MKNILVTGANGLLACNTIIELLNQGFLVNGLLRDVNKYVGPKHKNLTLIKGDILNYNDMETALSNCQYVIHIAALTEQNRINYNDYKEVNVTGSKNIIDASINSGIKRIVYVSTANTFGYGDLYNPGNEYSEIKYPFTKSYYVKSKKEAQKVLRKHLDKIETVIVNPTFMIGPYDSKPSSGRIILMGIKKRFVFCPPGGKNFVSVIDASRGVVKALTLGRAGESYILANENLTYVEFFKRLRKLVSNKFIIIKIPKFLLLTLGYFGSMLRTLGIKTDVSFNNMQSLCINNYYSNNKSISQLAMRYESTDYSINEAINWFKNNYKK